MNKSEETIEIEKVAGGDALLWVVAVSESVSERKMGRQRKRWQVWAHPRGGLVEGSEEGTNESSGLRDNLWEGKREVVICLDHRACCALLIPLLLSWSAHTRSLSETKLLLSREKLPTLTNNMPQHDVFEHLTIAEDISTLDLKKLFNTSCTNLNRWHSGHKSGALLQFGVSKDDKNLFKKPPLPLDWDYC